MVQNPHQIPELKGCEFNSLDFSSKQSAGYHLGLEHIPVSWLSFCRFLSAAFCLIIAKASMLSVIFFRSLLSHCCLSSFSAAGPPLAQASAQALFRRIKKEKEVRRFECSQVKGKFKTYYLTKFVHFPQFKPEVQRYQRYRWHVTTRAEVNTCTF